MRKPFSPEEINFIKENYSILGPKKMGEILDRNHQVIAQKAYRFGLHMYEEHKFDNKYNEENISHFIDIKDPFVAYFLGYFWADGSLERDTSRMKIVIMKSDFDDIKDRVMPLSTKWRYKEFTSYAGTLLFDLRLNNRELYKFLFSHGYMTKSGGSARDILRVIPKDLHHYWWRGLHDGDGNFNHSVASGTVKATISGPYDQNWDFVNDMALEQNIGFCIRKRIQGHQRSSAVLFEGECSVRKFCKYIYQGETFGLKRKLNSYLNWEEQKKNVYPNKRSKYRGVGVYYHDTNKWLMRFYKNNIRYASVHNDEIDAARAYDVIALKILGNKAILNFPQ